MNLVVKREDNAGLVVWGGVDLILPVFSEMDYNFFFSYQTLAVLF